MKYHSWWLELYNSLGTNLTRIFSFPYIACATPSLCYYGVHAHCRLWFCIKFSHFQIKESSTWVTKGQGMVLIKIMINTLYSPLIKYVRSEILWNLDSQLLILNKFLIYSICKMYFVSTFILFSFLKLVNS
jgi:hypothetical protein